MRLMEVMREQLRLGFRDRWEFLDNGVADTLVQMLPPRSQQVFVSYVLQQRVFEGVRRLLSAAAAIRESGIDQALQACRELVRRTRDDRRQELALKLLPDDGRN